MGANQTKRKNVIIKANAIELISKEEYNKDKKYCSFMETVINGKMTRIYYRSIIPQH